MRGFVMVYNSLVQIEYSIRSCQSKHIFYTVDLMPPTSKSISKSRPRGVVLPYRTVQYWLV